MRSIDADRLIEAITINPVECPGCPEPEWAEDMVNLIDAMPSVQPIRCRECAKWNTVFDRTKAEYGLCQIRSQLEATRYDDFCSRAERRTDDE